MTLEETRRIKYYGGRTTYSEGDVQKRPEKSYINDQENLIGPKNGHIEGLKKIGEENVVMKHS